MKNPKFGEVLVNPYASENNPHRLGIFVEVIYRYGRINRGKSFRFTDGNGHFWTTSSSAFENEKSILKVNTVPEILTRYRELGGV